MPEPTSPFEGVSILRLRPRFFALAALIAAFVGWNLYRSFDVVGVSWCLYAGIFLLLPMSRARWATRAVPARVEVRDDRLLVDGASVLPLRAVSSAFVLPGDGSGPILRLERRRRPAIELRVRDNGHAAALMRAMGLGPTQWAQCYQLPAPGPALWLWPAALLVALFALVFPFEAELLGKLRYLYITLPGMSGDACFLAVLLLQVAFVVLVAVAGFRAFRTRLVVGADGISLVRMRRARFLPYDEIADVKVEKRAPEEHASLTIALTTGETLVLKVLGSPDPQQIVARIQDAKAAAASGADADATLLHCSGTPAARIRALRALGRETGEGDYRSTPLSTEQLWQTFENSAADPEARASAAIALRARLDASCAPRLRVVATATAAPKLRVAIERAAGDDDAALEEALAALEADGVRGDGRGERSGAGAAPGGG